MKHPKGNCSPYVDSQELIGGGYPSRYVDADNPIIEDDGLDVVAIRANGGAFVIADYTMIDNLEDKASLADADTHKIIGESISLDVRFEGFVRALSLTSGSVMAIYRPKDY